MRFTELLNLELQRSRGSQFTSVTSPYSLHPEVFRVSLQEDPPSDDEIRDTAETDEEFGPPSIFPIATSYPICALPTVRLNPRYADRWPMAFEMKHDWPSIWEGTTIHLDLYLQEFRLPYRTTYITEIAETEYRGTPWRLHISQRKANDALPILRDGTIVSYRNSNTRCLRYIVDHCIFRDAKVAHLKVYCYNIDQDVCEVNSTRPPFLLVVPVQYCQVREYPAESYPYITERIPSHFHLPSQQDDYHPSQSSHFSDDEEDLARSPNILVRMYRRLCRVKH